MLSTFPDIKGATEKVRDGVVHCEYVIKALRLPWSEEVQATAEGVPVPSYCAQLSLASRPHWGPGYSGIGRRSSLFGMVMAKKNGQQARKVDTSTTGRNYDTQFREWDIWDDIEEEARDGKVYVYTSEQKKYYRQQKISKLGMNFPRAHSFQTFKQTTNNQK